MANPAQIRRERIKQLHDKFKDCDNVTFDPIYFTSLDLFPFVAKVTCRDYARAVLSLLMKEKKKHED